MNTRAYPIPELALQYIQYRKQQHFDRTTVYHDRMALRDFYQWLDMSKLQLTDLTRSHIYNFEDHLRKDGRTFAVRYSDKIRIANYFRWLQQAGHFHASIFDIFGLKAHRKLKVQLPEDAKKYLSYIKSFRKTSDGQTASISHFYKFLGKNHLSIKKIDRAHMEMFFQYLKSTGTGESHRSTTLYLLRVYLLWLYEHKKIKQDPHLLIRANDLPKVPKLLPRPLPPYIDLEIQNRLTQSDTVCHLALLLMRKTGLRMGELSNLSYECVRTDFNSQSFLKVPLGKLNSERLVPLDPTSLDLIKRIKEKAFGQTAGKQAYLIMNEDGSRPTKGVLHQVFKEVCDGIESSELLNSHRLRHTFASQLLNAGVSLVSLKELLGHHDIRMTLRYAAITQETIQKEFFSALEALNDKYALPVISPSESCILNPDQPIADLLKILKKWNESPTANQKAIASIQRKIKRIHAQLKTLN